MPARTTIDPSYDPRDAAAAAAAAAIDPIAAEYRNRHLSLFRIFGRSSLAWQHHPRNFGTSMEMAMCIGGYGE
ncbi:hypothetical protein ACJZ2D_008554 [Fusarium nematophilum]